MLSYRDEGSVGHSVLMSWTGTVALPMFLCALLPCHDLMQDLKNVFSKAWAKVIFFSQILEAIKQIRNIL